MTGCFIVLEGGEGSGKSTQAQLLYERLVAFGRDAVLTYEPGDSPLGEEIRQLLLHREDPVDERAELLLMLADRAQHVATVVKPALARDAVVVCDRFTPSSLAYQGIGRALGVEAVEWMSTYASVGLSPDLVVVLDLPDQVANARVSREPDRFERAGNEFHAAVRNAYRNLAPLHDWTLLDASGTREEVAEQIWALVRPILP
jgi:dTMP kinase